MLSLQWGTVHFEEHEVERPGKPFVHLILQVCTALLLRSMCFFICRLPGRADYIVHRRHASATLSQPQTDRVCRTELRGRLTAAGSGAGRGGVHLPRALLHRGGHRHRECAVGGVGAQRDSDPGAQLLLPPHSHTAHQQGEPPNRDPGGCIDLLLLVLSLLFLTQLSLL